MSRPFCYLALCITLGNVVSTATTNQTSDRADDLYGEVYAPNGAVWGLKDAYADMFKIGISFMKPSLFYKGHTSHLIMDNANVAIPETDLIWSYVEVAEGEYDFSFVDKYVKTCEERGIEPIGHCLIWKGIGWMSAYPEGTTPEQLRELYLKRISNYIKTMLSRYKDKIKRWVVVNEWFTQNGTVRTDYIMPETLGFEGVQMAFWWAKKYGGPDNKFYMSENTLWKYQKAVAVVNNLNKLRGMGLQIDGIFLQGHQGAFAGKVPDVLGEGFNTNPHTSDYAAVIQHFGKNGYEVVLSELDMTVLPDGWTCCRNTSLYDYPEDVQAKMDPYPDGLPADVAATVRRKWNAMFAMLIENRRYVTDVHLWSVTDTTSWFNKWPIRGRTDYPTLFGRDERAKSQYYDILRMGPVQPPNGTVIPNPSN